MAQMCAIYFYSFIKNFKHEKNRTTFAARCDDDVRLQP
jgi:hypothetical protein